MKVMSYLTRHIDHSFDRYFSIGIAHITCVDYVSILKVISFCDQAYGAASADYFML